MTDPPLSPATKTPSIAYHGRIREAWALALKVTLLTAVTLGIYRFWAKTRLRQYFWTRVTVNDEPLEYSGTGLELFLGFLIVLLILAPLYGAMAVGQQYAATTPWLAVALQFTPLLILLALFPIATFRARRYRLSRTLWRGVRLGQTGSTWGYWRRAFVYGLIGWLSLGLLRPLAHARLTSYLMNNTWVGGAPFSFQVRFKTLFWRWLLFWGLQAIGLICLYMPAILHWTGSIGGDPDAEGGGIAQGVEALPGYFFGAFWGLSVAGMVLLAAAAVAYFSYRLYKVRTFTHATRIEGIELRSGVRFWRVVGVYVTVSLVYLGLIGGLGAIAWSAFGFEGMFFGFAIGALLGGTLTAPFITNPLLAHYVDTLTISGDIDLDAIAQNPETAPKVGEGLASVFDIDGV